MFEGINPLSNVSVKSFDKNSINFKADKKRSSYPQYTPELQYDIVAKKPKKKYSVTQIVGFTSSAVVLAFFGLMLGRELKSSYLERKVSKALKNTTKQAKDSLTDIMNNCDNVDVKQKN